MNRGIRHQKCAFVARGPNMCKTQYSGFIESQFDAVFYKANTGNNQVRTSCTGNPKSATRYGVTHTLDLQQINAAADAATHVIFIPNDDPQLYVKLKTQQIKNKPIHVLDSTFTKRLRDATCPCQLPPRSPVWPGISSGFYILMTAMHMCEQVTVFCMENWGWGTPAYFESSVSQHFDDKQRNEWAADPRGNPAGEHCYAEEAAWVRTMRDAGTIQYFCHGDHTIIPDWRTSP